MYLFARCGQKINFPLPNFFALKSNEFMNLLVNESWDKLSHACQVRNTKPDFHKWEVRIPISFLYYFPKKTWLAMGMVWNSMGIHDNPILHDLKKSSKIPLQLRSLRTHTDFSHFLQLKLTVSRQKRRFPAKLLVSYIKNPTKFKGAKGIRDYQRFAKV